MTRQTIEVEVPDKYLPMSRPVEDANRISAPEIELSLAKESDLLDCARLMYTALPSWWWGQFEPEEKQPADDVRYSRLATRLSVFLHHPNLFGVIARVGGEFAGFAGWQTPRVDATAPAIASLSDLPASFMPGNLRKDLLDDYLLPRLGLSVSDWDRVWESIDVDRWNDKFKTDDYTRVKLTNGRPHWYLAPLCVEERFRGRGIGSVLMSWATDRADAGVVPSKADDVKAWPSTPAGEPTPMFLESMPNARPVYLRYGFESVPDEPYRLLREGHRTTPAINKAAGV